MDLTVQITVLKQPDGKRAGRIVISAEGQADPLHDTTDSLDAPSRQSAEYEAMLRAVEVVRSMQYDSVEFRLASQRMIDQLTGAQAIEDASLEPWYERLETALLKLDAWRVSAKYA